MQEDCHAQHLLQSELPAADKGVIQSLRGPAGGQTGPEKGEAL
jgi:hypothetical protein